MSSSRSETSPLLAGGVPGRSSSSSTAPASSLMAVREEGRSLTEPQGSQQGQSSGMNCGAMAYCAILAIVSLAAIISLAANAFRGGTGSVPIEQEVNFPFPTTNHPLRPTALWGGAGTRPFPTGAWFTNLALGDGDSPIVALPYSMKVTKDGIGVSYSAFRRTVSSKRVQDLHMDDLILSAIEQYAQHAVLRYDNLSVTVGFDTVGGGHFESPIVRGSPYVTLEYTDASPLIEADAVIMSVNGETVGKKGMTVKGTEFRLALSSWQTWVVYSSGDMEFFIKKGRMEAKNPMTGIVRVALLPHPNDPECEAVLSEHAFAYAKGGTVHFDVSGDTVKTSFRWEKFGFGELLMMALPHHVDLMDMDPDEAILPRGYQTIKGKMVGIVGSRWEMTQPLTTVQWQSKLPLNTNSTNDLNLNVIRKTLAKDILRVYPDAPDIYGFGKQCARMGRLALIAEELEEYGLQNQAVDIMETVMGDWLRGDNRDLLIYDKTWGGVVTYDGLNDVNADFGNAWYNDHHYHYGYFLYAAAVVNKFRPGFYLRYKQALDFIASDIANMGGPSGIGGIDGSLFPVARHKDFFDGHSWASGLFPQSNGKSQESSSEIVNSYYAVYLWGMSIGNANLRDWGRILLASELHSVKRYWQTMHDDDIYDSIFAANHMVGLVAGLEAVHLTWFGDNEEFVSGINMLPFTPITEELLSQEFMRELWPSLKAALNREDDPPGPQWAGYLYLAQAIVEPKKAWANIEALEIYDAANSKTNSLYWIATRPDPGSYNASDYKFPVTIPEMCQANTACFAQDLTDLCCPSKEGNWLGCCPSYAVEPSAAAICSANTRCKSSGLDSDEELCCPTLTGVYLSCCDNEVPSAPSTEAACSNNAGCEGLLGNCCPTTDGEYLGCCGSDTGSSDVSSTGSADTVSTGSASSAGDDASCASHSNCSGLEGKCCPTEAGDMLLCCSG